MKMQKLMGALILILMLGATPVTAQNMSDSQVLEYVKEGIRQGKEQKQLASELARKGLPHVLKLCNGYIRLFSS